jgi:hypothetical protein
MGWIIALALSTAALAALAIIRRRYFSQRTLTASIVAATAALQRAGAPQSSPSQRRAARGVLAAE